MKATRWVLFILCFSYSFTFTKGLEVIDVKSLMRMGKEARNKKFSIEINYKGDIEIPFYIKGSPQLRRLAPAKFHYLAAYPDRPKDEAWAVVTVLPKGAMGKKLLKGINKGDKLQVYGITDYIYFKNKSGVVFEEVKTIILKVNKIVVLEKAKINEEEIALAKKEEKYKDYLTMEDLMLSRDQLKNVKHVKMKIEYNGKIETPDFVMSSKTDKTSAKFKKSYNYLASHKFEEYGVLIAIPKTKAFDKKISKLTTGQMLYFNGLLQRQYTFRIEGYNNNIKTLIVVPIKFSQEEDD